MVDLAIFKNAFSVISPLLGSMLKKKLKGTPSVVTFLRACGTNSLENEFESIYAHAIVEYSIQGIDAKSEEERNQNLDERILWIDYFSLLEVRKIIESGLTDKLALEIGLEIHFRQGGDRTRLQLKEKNKQFSHCLSELNILLGFYKKYQKQALEQNQSYSLMLETNLETQKLILEMQKEILEIKNQNGNALICFGDKTQELKFEDMESLVRDAFNKNQKEILESIRQVMKESKDSTLHQYADKIFNIQTIVNAEIKAKTQSVEIESIKIAEFKADRQTNIIQHADIVNIQNVTIHDDFKKGSRKLGGSPFQSDIFLGREKDLEEIYNRLSQNKNLLLLVNGEGGIGKTTLASKYYLQYESEYKHLIWIYADSGIKNALYSLIPALGLKWDANIPEEQREKELFQCLLNLPKPSLLIFDNANNAEDLEQNYTTLKKLNNFHILLTTRANEMGEAPIFKIIALDEATCIELFNMHYPQFDVSETELLKEILKAVGYNTLVVEVLSKNLREFNKKRNQYSLADLLSDIQSKGLLHIQSRGIRTAYHNETYMRSTPEKILSAMYDLSGLTEEEIKLISQFAILPAENLRFELLEEIMNPRDKQAWEKELDSLALKGWIEFRESSRTYKISPVIQTIVREKNQHRLYGDSERMILKLNNLLGKDESTNIITKFPWIPYGKSVISFFTIVLNETVSILYNNLAMVLNELGGETNLLKAKELLKKVLDTDVTNYGETSFPASVSQSNLAKVLTELGGRTNLLEAKELLDRVLVFNISYFRENTPKVAGSQSDLAIVLLHLGGKENLLNAKELLVKALASDITNFGETSSLVALSQSNLAIVLQHLDGEINLLEAKELLKKALASDIKNFGETAPKVAASQSNLATVLSDLGGETNLLDAKELLKKALVSDIKNFGETAPKVAIIESNLATVLMNLGGETNLLEAKELLEKALASDTINFGETTPTVALKKSNLALVLQGLGGETNLLEAKKFLEEALVSDLKNFGETAPPVVDRQLNLAIVLQHLGGETNLLKARELLEKTLISNITNFGETAPTVATSQSSLAMMLQRLGGETNLLEAKELLKKALASDIKNFGEAAPTVATYQSNLAIVLQHLGGETNLLEAKELFKKVMDSVIANFGNISPTVALMQSNFATVLMKLGGKTNLVEAKKLLERSYLIFLSHFDESHHNSKIIKGNLEYTNRLLSKQS